MEEAAAAIAVSVAQNPPTAWPATPEKTPATKKSGHSHGDTQENEEEDGMSAEESPREEKERFEEAHGGLR